MPHPAFSPVTPPDVLDRRVTEVLERRAAHDIEMAEVLELALWRDIARSNEMNLVITQQLVSRLLG